MADIFISYARDEQARAELLKSQFESLGLSCFFDLDGGIQAGDAFPERITQAVRSSKVVVGCWSPLAVTRPWVRRECLMARDLGKLVPVAILPLSPRDLPAEFYDVSFVDLSGFAGQDDHFGWSQTLAAIASRLDAWTQENAASDESQTTLDKSADLRRRALDIRRRAAAAPQVEVIPASAPQPQPAAQPAPNWGGATALWQSLKGSWDARELQIFVDSFPGTPEAYEARKRLNTVSEADKVLAKGIPVTEGSIRDFITRFPDHPKSAEFEKDLPRKKFVGEWAFGGAMLAGIAGYSLAQNGTAAVVFAIFGAVGGWIVGNIAFAVQNGNSNKPRGSRGTTRSRK